MSLTFGIEDEHKQLSIDTVELNNCILSLRALVKKSKVFVLRELSAYIKRQKMKQSKLSDDKGKRLGRKIVNRLAEIRLLKKFNISKLCKLILANIMTHNELETDGDNMSKQERLVVRLSCRPEIAKFVMLFRESHSDWPTLVHFLLYKNTSGKWKTAEQKRKKRPNKKGDLPFPIVNTESVPEIDLESSTIRKFTVFKEAHDKELLLRQKEILAVSEMKTDAVVIPRFHIPRRVDYDSDDVDEALALITSTATGSHQSKPDVPPTPDLLSYLNIPHQDIQLEPKSRSPSAAIPKKGQDAPLFRINGECVKKTISCSKTTAKAQPVHIHREIPVTADENFREGETSVIMLEDDGAMDDLLGNDDGENPLGEDDVEMKQEVGLASVVADSLVSQLRERKPKPGDAAIYKRALYQQGHRTRQAPQQPHRRGGVVLSRPRSQAAELDPEGLHPSWVAKRQQKERLALSISANGPPIPGRRIVFGEGA